MGAADLAVRKCAECKPGEALTLGSDGEGSGLAHLVSVRLTLLIYRNQVAVTKWCATWGIGSVEAHPGEEGDGTASLAHEPIEVLSEDALTLEAEVREDRVKAALRGGGLPATVKEADEVFAHFGDLVAVEADDAHALFGVVVNRGVGFLPVSATGNGGGHFDFDLAHLKSVCSVCRVGFPPDVLNIGHWEGCGSIGGRFGDRHRSTVYKLGTDCVANVVSFGDDFFAVVVDELSTFDGQFNKQDGAVDDKGDRFFHNFVTELTIEFAESITELVSLLDTISDEIEAPKDS